MSYFHNDVFKTRAVTTTAMSTAGADVLCGFVPGKVSIYNATDATIWEWDSTMTNTQRGAIAAVGTTPANDYFGVTVGVGSEAVSIKVAGDTDIATTAAALVVALNASTDASFANITWSVPSGGVVLGVADNLTGDEYLAKAVMFVEANGANAARGTITAFGGYSMRKQFVGATSAATAYATSTVPSLLKLKNDAVGQGFTLTGGIAALSVVSQTLHITAQPDNKSDLTVQAAT